MTVNCKYCGSELAEDSPAVIAQKIDEQITNWEAFESDGRYGHAVNSIVADVKIGEFVKVVAKKLKPAIDEIESGYYGSESEYPQGTTFNVHVILQYGDSDMFFKKLGTADSYGEISWNGGPLTIVKPKLVTATVWE